MKTKLLVAITINIEDLLKDNLIILRGLDHKLVLAKIIEYNSNDKKLTLYSKQFGDGYSFTHTFSLLLSKNDVMSFKRSECHLFGQLQITYTLIGVVTGHIE